MGINRVVALAGGLTLVAATPLAAQLRANEALAVPPPSASPVAALVAAATEQRPASGGSPRPAEPSAEPEAPSGLPSAPPLPTPVAAAGPAAIASASGSAAGGAGVRPSLVLESRDTVLAQSNPEAPAVSSAPALPQPLPARERLGLGVPSAARADTGEQTRAEGDRGSLAGAWRSVAALGAVLLLVAATAWMWRGIARRSGGLAGAIGAGGRAPSGVLEVLGRFPVGGGTTLVLLKLDRRVLLLSHTARLLGRGGGAAGFRTLAEITDPEEVASLILKTRDEQDAARARSFTGMLQRFGRAHDRAELEAVSRPPTPPPAEPRPALDVVVGNRGVESAGAVSAEGFEPVMGPDRARALLESMRDRIPVVDLTRRSRESDAVGSGLRDRLNQARAQARAESVVPKPTPVVRVETARLRERTAGVQGRVMGGGARGMRA